MPKKPKLVNDGGRIMVGLPRKTVMRLKVMCAARGEFMSVVVNTLVERYLLAKGG